LNASGRPMLLSAEGGVHVAPGAWMYSETNSWRTAPQKPTSLRNVWGAIMLQADQNDMLWKFAGPGHFNDAGPLYVILSALGFI
jgi:hypothetical protein